MSKAVQMLLAVGLGAAVLAALDVVIAYPRSPVSLVLHDIGMAIYGGLLYRSAMKD
jgi:hypothetical protein